MEFAIGVFMFCGIMGTVLALIGIALQLGRLVNVLDTRVLRVAPRGKRK